MLYFVTRYIIPLEGNDSHSEEKFDNDLKARKRFYSILAADIDKATIAYELVQIVREDGICVASQVFDNRVPEPEDEVTANE